MPEGLVQGTAALDRAVSALRAVVPELDASGLADILWLASRMAPASSATPPEGTRAPAAAPTPADVPGDAAGPGPSAPRPDLPSAPLGDRAAAGALHERLPGSASRVRGHAVGVPRGAALPGALRAARALRPWKRPWRAGRHRALDLAATVDGYARSGELVPVFTAAPERWFDLILVVDRSPSMHVWRETIDDFAGILTQVGAFRTLRVLDLQFGTDAGVELYDPQGRPTPVGRLSSPHGRHLLLTVSDVAAGAWRTPDIWRQLRTWARSTPVALLNPLPAKLWRRTGLNLPTVRVTPGPPGAVNAELAFSLPPLLPGQGGAGGWLPLPVLSLSPHSLDRWSRTVMQATPEGCAAVLLPPDGHVPDQGLLSPPAPPGGEARAERFLRVAAPSAARLAVLCSPFDRLSLALLHVIRQELVPAATTADIAEVLTSGLFALDTSPEGSVTLAPAQQAQARLRQDLAQHEVWRLHRALDRRLAEEGGGRGRLPAVVRGQEGTDDFPAGSAPFGHAVQRTLELLGLPAPVPRDDTTVLAVRLALAMLPVDRLPTPQELSTSVDRVMDVLTRQGIAVDRAALTREMETRVAVFAAPSVVSLNDPTGHQPWLNGEERGHEQHVWELHRCYLEQVRSLTPHEVHRIDESTDVVLGRLEDPRRAGPWLRSGLVIAPEQSSKETHLIGLAAKAIDAGYRLIVVLAGTSNAARMQTQVRVDEGLLGYDSARLEGVSGTGRVGVGTVSPATPVLLSVTNRTEQGDFSPRTTGWLSLPRETFPLLFVIKKNQRIIDSLREWLTHRSATIDPGTGREVVGDSPLLVIDATDGPRVASVDGNARPAEASLRALLGHFAKAAYVAYSATPFTALLDPGETGREDAPRLFPGSFVCSLPVPPGYLGPERVFGTPEDAPGGPRAAALPLVRHVTDQEPWMPVPHHARHVPVGELPGSLLEALNAFVLACAARQARGHLGVHNSMLVSISRFTSVQEHVCGQLAERVRVIAGALRDSHSLGAARLMDEFRQLWRADFLPTTDVFPGAVATRVSWDEVAPHVPPAVRKMRVMAFNSVSRSAPAYEENAAEGLNVVAVGGAKLERGANLEGLTVGYQLRSAGAYDAMGRMGGWFGYRVGYEDLCRLYTTPDLAAAYAHLASVTGELRRDLQDAAEMGLTPQDLALRIRDPGTAQVGLRTDAQDEVRPFADYAGRTAETVRFSMSRAHAHVNFRVLEALVRSLDGHAPGDVDPANGSIRWRSVPVTPVLEFLDAYLPGHRHHRQVSRAVAEYVRRRAASGALMSWTVQLMSRSAALQEVDVAGHRIGPVVRRPRSVAPEGTYTVGRLLSPRDECRDLDADQLRTALEVTRSRRAARRGAVGEQPFPHVPAVHAIRAVRRADQPLLTIYPLLPPAHEGEHTGLPVVGFAASFPYDPAGAGVAGVVPG
ncbi:Z1 domain-containing protein [Streptomyces sp. NPDC029041]|uniref:Z1 domain-containing protein n=1 Tax=Streptomyces sp. NPDC029041 TaxID=3155727 RepID=UPI0033D495E4